MFKKTLLFIFVLSLTSIALIGCGDAQNESETENYQNIIEALEGDVDDYTAQIGVLNAEIGDLVSEIDSLNAEIEVFENQSSTEAPAQAASSLISTALEVMALIEDQDFAALQAHVHPNDGVRFSPYAHVNTQTDLVFPAQDIPALPNDSTVLTWGSFDGSGDPIEFDFMDYYDRFIYDQDYLNPEMMGINTIVGTGNTLVNITDVYPSGEFVEFHFSGFDPQYDGMDWRSLILVFEEVNGEWLLVGIVHNEWTI